MRTTGLLPIEQEAMEASVKQFKAAREGVIQELTRHFELAVGDKLQQAPIWHRYPSGDHSFCDDIVCCALQIQDILKEEESETNERLQEAHCKELLVSTITWLVWRRVVEKQTVHVILDSYSTPSSEMLEASAVAAEKVLLELDTPKAPTSDVPPRPPDTTGPAPKPQSRRRGLLGRHGRPQELHPPDVDTSVEPPTPDPAREPYGDSPRTIRKLFGKRK